MSQKYRGFPYSYVVLGTLVIPTLLISNVACTDQQEASKPAAQAPMDHSQMDHSQHDMSAAGHDEHAAHKAMMSQQTEFHISTAKYSLPNVTLVDMLNKETPLPAIFDTDKPVMVNFIFTTCTTICPVMTATFAQAQDLLGPELENVQMVSISIDPEQDTPQKLLEYAYKYQAAPMWNFYTGSKDDVITALKAFDAYRGDKMNHEPITLLRKNKQSEWVRIEGLTSASDLVAEFHKVTGTN